jgi:hypothetical protein
MGGSIKCINFPPTKRFEVIGGLPEAGSLLWLPVLIVVLSLVAQGLG